MTEIMWYDGEFRASAANETIDATVKAYHIMLNPNARLVRTRIQDLGHTGNICPVHGQEVEAGVLFVAVKPISSTLKAHTADWHTCPTTAQ